MIVQWNKLATFNVVMTYNLSFMTYGTLLIEHRWYFRFGIGSRVEIIRPTCRYKSAEWRKTLFSLFHAF